MRTKCALAIAAALAGSAWLPSAEELSAADNPLAGMPSKPGPHIQQLKVLGDNAWLNLGQAAPDARYDVARGRSWCAKMAFAADLGGAFFCGTGVHGAAPEGRYMDDLWFYDACAHRWICLYPGADPKTLKLKLDLSGFEVNERGDHIPVSYLSHAYCNTTYNPDLKLYHIMWTQCPWWGKVLPQRWEWLDQSVDGVKKKSYGNVGPIIASPKHPLCWNVEANKWTRTFVEGPGPDKRFEGIVEYVPALKKTIYTHQGKTWFYDYAANAWHAGAAVPKSVAGYDSNGCFDTKRERVYAARGTGFAYYDIEEEAWHEVNAGGQPENLGNTNSAQLYYDTANDIVLWHKSKGPIFIYDIEKNAWTDLGNTTPEIPWKKFNPASMCTHGFYDTNLNVHFFYLAGDSGKNDATLLAYRYKRAESKVEAAK